MRHQTILTRIVFPFLICLFIQVSCFAGQNPRIGKVVALRGKIFATDPEMQNRTLSINGPVFLHDTIHTGKGRIQLMFEDNTLVTLGRNTNMEILSYFWKPGDSSSSFESKIHEGSFRIMGGAITRTAPNHFKTHGPSGTIGIRGSMYAGIIKGPVMSVLFQGGKGIYVMNDFGRVEITQPGFATRIKSADQPPEPPQKMSVERLRELENSLAAAPDQEAKEKTAQTEKLEQSPSESQGLSGQLPETLFNKSDSENSPPADTVQTFVATTNESVLTSTQDQPATPPPPTGKEIAVVELLNDIGFYGGQSNSIPASGIWEYAGKSIDTIETEAAENFKFIVNWDNHRLLGFEDLSFSGEDKNSGFGFGEITSTGEITNFHVFGSDYPPIETTIETPTNDTFFDDGIRALTGNETFGHFYGSDQEAMGIAIEGYDVLVQDQSDKKFWSDIIAATFENKSTNPYSGIETWKGFFVGVSENMANPNLDRKIFCNTVADDFSFTVDKNNGTYVGLMTGSDFNDTNNMIVNMKIGGDKNDSAYITDQIIASRLSGSDTIISSSGTSSLKPYGNFMVTSTEAALSSHTTWGYWEVAYVDPDTENDYHVHVPGSVWIAGNPTPSPAITNFINTRFTGKYNGEAKGVMFDRYSQMSELTNGKTSLDINFGPNASTPVNGSISFDQVILPVTSTMGALSAAGFQANISNATSSNVSGTFYGPNAEAVGGKFSAEMSDGYNYHGIFAGDR